MKLTFALGTHAAQHALFNELKVSNVLISFAYPKIMDGINYQPDYLILDSGAFTAWNTGKQVDVIAYGDWVEKNQNAGKKLIAVNLDVIPGEVGRTSTKAERAAGMKQSLENANYLRSRGLEVMEVFHQDEPLVFLDTLLDRLPPDGILGISPRNDVNINSKLSWQNAVLRHLYQRCGVKNMPRTHGLAVTSMRMMKQFPYYSVDSSSWASSMLFGTFTNEWGKMNGLENLLPGRPNTTNFLAGIVHGLRKSVDSYQHIGDSITTLWAQRGIVWKD
jgi:hypothetical protein